ncbi:hypothetical protein SDC9_15082 [bioreactor metagenome]|uniref:Uncharacterized protein n=1 Tax=bioreactor metagenome TaxID=1076179 RepID=A0A644TQX7_9ZZZZ|nr:diguanylate cyclase [Negativicutes bacterium]
MISRKYALNISLIYFIFGILWILLSDIFVGTLSLNQEVMTLLSVIKGGVYVSLSAFLIYMISNHYISKLSQANQRLQDGYYELTTTHEQLAATEEELRQQFDELQQSYEKIITQNVILSTIQDTTEGLINQLDVDILLNKILEGATDLGGTQHGLLNLLDEETKTFHLKAGLGLFKDQAGLLKIDQNAEQPGQVLQTGQFSIVEDYMAWEHRLNMPHTTEIASAIHVPLKINQKVAGTLGLAYTDPGRLIKAKDIDLLERFASLASIALSNAQLHTQLQQELKKITRREETIRAIFDETNDAIFVHNAESTELINCNTKAEELLGFTLQEMQKMGMAKVDALCYNGHLAKVLKSALPEVSQLLEMSAANRQGDRLYLEANHRKVTIGDTQCIITAVRDISERKKTDAELAHAQAYKLALLNAIPDLMVLFDNQGFFIDYHQPTNFELYAQPEHFMGKNIADIFPGEFTQKALGLLKQTINNRDSQTMEYQLLQNNQLNHFEARFVKISDSEILAIIRNITHRKQTEQQLEHMSLHDPLTEIYNRTYFEEELLAIRNRNDKGVGIIVCDVDGLKLINDTLGHRSGDKLLKTVAKLLQSCTTFPDVVARIGGDEFAILAFEPDQQGMTDLTAAIKETVEKHNKTNPQLPLSLSIGWAANFDTGDSIDELFKEADNNMYREKMHQSMSTRNAIVQAMMHALEARDYITEGHADRLQELVEALGRKLKLSDPMIADLKLLAQFHDIGKVGIPDRILFKPNSLTQDELAVMRRHAEIGFRIARSTPDFAPIAEWILKHHEWWNGKGYPLNLAGEKIPLACRILALADAFDAMTNERPYRKAMNRQEALNEIRRCAGTQFDPALVEPFIKMLTDQC